MMNKLFFVILFVTSFTLLMIKAHPTSSSPNPTETVPIKKSKSLSIPDEEVLLFAPVEEMNEDQVNLTPPSPVIIKKDPLMQAQIRGDSIVHLENVIPVNPEDDGDGEILVTANSMVFRPLFSYRKTVGQRRRVYSSSPVRRASYPAYYYTRYPSYSSYPRRDQSFPTVL